MKYLITFFSLLLFSGVFAQLKSDPVKEKEAYNQMCEHLRNSSVDLDTAMDEALDTYLESYLMDLMLNLAMEGYDITNISEDDANEFVEKFIIGFMKDCDEVHKKLYEESIIILDSEHFTDLPLKSVITQSQINEFKNLKKATYKDEESFILINKTEDEWNETSPGSFEMNAKLTWTKPNKFTIQPNNQFAFVSPIYLRKGDSYEFELIEKTDEYFLVQFYYEELGKYMNFEIYPFSE